MSALEIVLRCHMPVYGYLCKRNAKENSYFCWQHATTNLSKEIKEDD